MSKKGVTVKIGGYRIKKGPDTPLETVLTG